MLVVKSAGRPLAGLVRNLRKAGYRVETCQPESIRCREVHRPSRRKKNAIPARLPRPRTARGQSLALQSLLKACLGMFPGIQTVCLSIVRPEVHACQRHICLGRSSRSVPALLPWDQFPILRAAFERKKSVYLPDASLLPRRALWNGDSCGGCLAIPFLQTDPPEILLISHRRDAITDAETYSRLRMLSRLMESILENATLRNRLIDSENRYRSILLAAPFLIALLDSDGTVREVNPKTMRELRRQGFSARQVIGLNLLQSDSVPEEVRRLLQDGLQKHEAVSQERIVLPLPRGNEVFRVHALPLRSNADSRGELLVIAEMITGYQQILDDAERTERLAAIGRVAASLAHEINNPLQALRSHLELIRSYPLSEEEREQSFRILEREVERLDETTRRVLGFARPAPDILQQTSITGVVEQALALSQNYLHNQHVEIVTDLPSALPPVMAAPGQLIQVFLNIILNAAHAMQGNGLLEVRAHSLGDRVEIVFTNNGPPIPAEYLARIFDPFFTTRPEGTGLGLSISYAILQRHGGTIRAANLPHRKGVAFTITLPFHAPAGATG
jgi:PAS domain S-box-containing protein